VVSRPSHAITRANACANLEVESDAEVSAPGGGSPSGNSTPEVCRARGVGAGSGVTCASCGRSFGSKRGLSVHERVAHPADYHSRAAIGHTGSKRRWTYEE